VLRPRFPSALFFTFELDTLFLNPEEVPTTRNLLVASGFGFSVPKTKKDCHGSNDQFPPMRGSSQAGVGYAAKAILQAFISGRDDVSAKQDGPPPMRAFLS